MKPVSLTQKTGKLSNGFKFLIVIVCGGAALLLFGALFIVLGAERLTLQDVIKGLFRYDETDFNDVIVRDIRLPRLLADVVVGASLALAGAIMQGNTKNPMADSGLMGVSSGSVFAIIVAMAFMPNISRLERMGISCLGAGVATLLVYGIAMIGRRGHTAERMVLSGMAISTLFSSVTTGIVLKEGLSGELMKYTAGSSASTIWLDIRVAGPCFIAGVLLSLVIARSLTVMNLGEDVSTGLGANVKLIKLTSTVIVLVLSALAVIVIGPVGYIGLMIPHIVRPIVGTDYRYVLPASAVLGALLVVVVDIIARIVIAPLEFPVGILITMVGVPFFIFVSRRQRSDTFD